MHDHQREYIAIGFNNDCSKIIPVIRMNGADGLTKVIQGVSGISQISLYHVDFIHQTAENIGNIPWQDSSLTSDVVIQYDPAELRGTVLISALNQDWDFQVSPSQTTAEPSPAENRPMLNRDRVRQLEQEKEIKILWPDELAALLQQEIYGQEEALKYVSEIIAANLRRKTPEVEVILMLGPTGVGKTETGKALAGALEKLTGQEYGFQQISMNQFINDSNLAQFFGSPPSYVGYKDSTIFEVCRSNPYQVFLLDEVEKATDRFWTGIMECFSNNSVKLADNSPEIDLSHAIFILTSNIPIDMKAYQAASNFRKKEICRDALTRTCGHPEVAGKITNCLAFQELPLDAVTDIVLKFVIQELQAYDMELASMDEQLMVELKEMHRSSAYGARSIKDAVRTALTSTVYDRNIGRYKDKKVRLSGHADNIMIEQVS